MKKRKTLSKKRRFELFKRDSFTCQYCGAHPPAAVLVLDHIVPFADGGECDDDNLVTSCEPCNQGKGDRSLSAVPASLAEKAAAAAEKEAQIRGYSEIMAAQRQRVDDDAWDVADLFIDCHQTKGIRRDWLQSIRQFVERIGVHECIRAMELAVARKPWAEKDCFRYFCGICWRIARGE